MIIKILIDYDYQKKKKNSQLGPQKKDALKKSSKTNNLNPKLLFISENMIKKI